MAHSVWKFPIPVQDEFVVLMPREAKLLRVDTQLEQPCVWALVNLELQSTKEPRYFRLAGTGHPIEDIEPLTYVGTFMLHDGHLVFHLFEEDAE